MIVKETGGWLNVLEASRAQCFKLALTSTTERLSELKIKTGARCLTVWGLLAREVSVEGEGEGAEVEK